MLRQRPWLNLLAAFAAVAVLGGCGAVDEARNTVDKTQDCAEIVGKVANINLSPDAVAADVQQAVTELDQTIEGLGNEDVKAAARSLAADLKEFQQALARTSPADVDRALTEVTQSAENLARTCNVPVDQLTGS